MKIIICLFAVASVAGCATYSDTRGYPLRQPVSFGVYLSETDYGENEGWVEQVYSRRSTSAIIDKSIAACPNLVTELEKFRNARTALVRWQVPGGSIVKRALAPRSPTGGFVDTERRLVLVPPDIENRVTVGGHVLLFVTDQCQGINRLTGVF